MENELVSVIVPVYNSEKYIKKCIKSIVNQSYMNLEIIIVNDGSNDNSGILCEGLAQQDKRIKIFNKENGGSNSARKLGVHFARGSYIVFVDSDDWIDANMIQELMKIANKSGAEMVVSAFRYSDNREGHGGQNKNTIQDGLYKKDILEKDIYKRMILDSKNQFGILPSVWGKLFKYDIIAPNIQKVNDEIFYGEDAVCTYTSCLDAKSIYVTNEAWYFYRKREDSVTSWKDERLFENNRLIFKHLYQYYLKAGEYKEEFLFQVKKYMKILNAHAMKKIYGINIASFWLFPYDLVDRDKKIIIYGAGSVGKSYYLQLQQLNLYDVVLWVDSDKDTNELVSTPDSIMNYVFDLIVIAILDDNIANQIRKHLWDMGIEDNKIIWKKPKNMILV